MTNNRKTLFIGSVLAVAVLAGIVGYGEMAQDAAAPGSDQARHLDKVLQAAQRGGVGQPHLAVEPR